MTHQFFPKASNWHVLRNVIFCLDGVATNSVFAIMDLADLGDISETCH